MFPHPGFIDSVTALGNFERRISIQGVIEEAHVATTGRAESFKRILHGLGELQRRGQLVTTNMCVTAATARCPTIPSCSRSTAVRSCTSTSSDRRAPASATRPISPAAP